MVSERHESTFRQPIILRHYAPFGLRAKNLDPKQCESRVRVLQANWASGPRYCLRSFNLPILRSNARLSMDGNAGVG